MIPEEPYRKFSGIKFTDSTYRPKGIKEIKAIDIGQISDIESLDDLMKLVFKYDCITSISDVEFQKMLVRCIPIEPLFNLIKNKTVDYDYWKIELEDDDISHISFRKKGDHEYQTVGKSYIRNMNGFFEEGISSSELEKQYFDIIREIGFSNTLTSPQKMSEDLILKCSGSILPSLYKNDIPEDILEIAYNACNAGKMETSQIGHIHDVLDVDGNMFYGSMLADELSPKNAKWYKGRYEDYKDADFGGAHLTITVPPGEGNVPFRFMWTNEEKVSYPVGTFVKHCMMKPEIDLYYGQYGRSKGYKLEDIQGIWGYATVKTKPFKRPIEIIYATMQKTTNILARSIVKQSGSLAWGKMSSIHYNNKLKMNVASKLYNPLIVSNMISRARVKILLMKEILNIDSFCDTIDGFVGRNSSSIAKSLLNNKLYGFKEKYTGPMTNYSDFLRIPSDNEMRMDLTPSYIGISGGKITLKTIKQCNTIEEAKNIVNNLGIECASHKYNYGSSFREHSLITLNDIDYDLISLSSPNVNRVKEIYWNKMIKRAYINMKSKKTIHYGGEK